MSITKLWDPVGSTTGPGSIYMWIRDISVDFEVFSTADPISQQNNSVQFDLKIGSGRYSGFGNPKISFNGDIDLNYSLNTGNEQPADGSFITVHQLGSLARYANKYWLYDDMFGNNGAGTIGSKCVMLKSVKYDRAADYGMGSKYVTDGALVKYSIEFLQVNPNS